MGLKLKIGVTTNVAQNHDSISNAVWATFGSLLNTCVNLIRSLKSFQNLATIQSLGLIIKCYLLRSSSLLGFL